MIKNIVFDMGNVLTIYNATEYISGYVENEKDFQWIRNHLCASVEWLQMDRGTITDEAAIASICKRIPKHCRAIYQGVSYDTATQSAYGEASGSVRAKWI